MTEKTNDENEIRIDESPKPFCKSVRNYFREYCVCSSIHGFRYFGEKRTHFERAWWFIVFSITLGICIFFIREVYKKWERSPVIVSFATTETPIYEMPFPAVTICPESKSNLSLFNHTNILQKIKQKKKLTETEFKNFEYMELICQGTDLVEKPRLPIFSAQFYDVLANVSVKFHNIFYDCNYMDKTIKCEENFQPILTDEGLCYTFNMLDRSEIYNPNVVHYKDFHRSVSPSDKWSLENGYSEKAGLKAYPKRALMAGTKYGLKLTLLSYKSNIGYTCRSSLQGFRVMLHTPTRIPLFSQQYFRVPLNQQVVAAIQPNMITTSDSVKMYNQSRRKCFFPSERTLKYFKQYTSLNCKLECLTNYTLEVCKCVNFYMPHDNTTNLCGTAKITCMKEAERRLQLGILYKEINPEAKNTKVKECDCKPICSDLTYDVETSQSDWQWREWYKGVPVNGLSFDYDKVHMSKLTLFFKSTQFITSQRHELYGPTDFLANFGGLLGLFTGFSVLSLMEIIYFLSVRLFCNIRLYGYWTGPEI